MGIQRDPLKAYERAEQAASALVRGRAVQYRRGLGGRDPEAPHPAERGYCDESGLVAWCYGIPRSPSPWCPFWITPENVYMDALGKQLVFVPAEKPTQGAIIVRPGRFGFPGRIGLVSRTWSGGDLYVYDASKEGERETGRAITLRHGDPYFRAGAIIVEVKQHAK